MKTVPSAINASQQPLATTDQTVQAANGSTRLVKRAIMPGVQPDKPPALVQEPADPRGQVLDQEA